jgi:hypothetical protein
MPKTIQIRDIDDATYAALARRAAAEGVTVPELLRQQATVLAQRPTIEDWIDRVSRRRSEVTTSQVLETFDQQRGEWPA